MRRNRILLPGAIYHVTSQINRREHLLTSKQEKQFLLAAISRAKKKYPFVLEGFCIMNNHIHLIIRPTKGSNLSRIMQWIKSVYAMAWNRRNGFSGHVWGGRFFSRILNGFGDLIRVISYVDDNPVQAHLTTKPTAWEESGLYHRRTGKRSLIGPPPRWLMQIWPHYELLLLTD